jgi:thymidylate kinase
MRTGEDGSEPHEMLHPLLERTFDAFARADVRWCILRLPPHPGAHSGDIDLLFDSADARRLPSILDSLGYIQLPTRSRDAESHFLSYHLATDCWIWLHVVTDLCFGRAAALRTDVAAGCLARCERNGALTVLAPDDAFWSLLLHCLLDKGHIAPRHREGLQELSRMAQPDGVWTRVVERAHPDFWYPGSILESVHRGDWDTLERLAAALAETRVGRWSVDNPRVLAHRGLDLTTTLLHPPWGRGLSVALLGPDGAGKSTLAAGIQASFVFPVRSIYGGLTGGMLEYIARLHIPGIVVLGRILVLWSRYLAAQYHKSRGRLVIFDRYIYDAVAPHPDHLNWMRRLSRWAAGHACPGPDLVFVLDVPGDVMYARKGEYSAETLEHWRQSFLALQSRLPHIEIVDTTRSKDEVRIDVVDRIWRRYAARVRRSEP